MKKKKNEKSSLTMISKLEGTPLKFCKGEKENELNIVVLSDKAVSRKDYEEKLKEIVGVKDTELACQIFNAGANALSPLHNDIDGSNIIAQALHDLRPKDAVEARLAVQATVLFVHGLANLTVAQRAETMIHAEHFTNKAIKLIRLHNETIETLNRYRRGGEQKVTVTHALVAGQAIVNNFNRGGDNTKNEGESPCSSKNAEQKPEPMDITHVDNQQCETAAVAFTEGVPQAQ